MNKNNIKELINAINSGCEFEVFAYYDDEYDEYIYNLVFVENNKLYTTNENGEKTPLTEDMLNTIRFVDSKGEESNIYHIQFEHLDRSHIENLISDELKQVIVHLEQMARMIWDNGCYSCIKIQGIDNYIINPLNFEKENIGLISIGWGGQCTSDESYIEYYPQEDRFEIWGNDFGRGSSVHREISNIVNFCKEKNITLTEKAKKWLKIN